VSYLPKHEAALFEIFQASRQHLVSWSLSTLTKLAEAQRPSQEDVHRYGDDPNANQVPEMHVGVVTDLGVLRGARIDLDRPGIGDDPHRMA